MTLASTESGIVYPSEGYDDARLRAALKEHDRNLDFYKQIDPQWNRWVYKITYAVSPERVEPMFSWRDTNGYPLDPSSGILEQVKLLDKNTRVKAPDPDAKNASLARAREKDWQDTREDPARTALRDAKRTIILPRSRSLYSKRAKRRARGLDA